jgi:chitinase
MSIVSTACASITLTRYTSPGAPDRGGKEDDPDNFVLLLKDVKQAFDADPRQYGLSFTAPTSYWYLRWFKIEKLWRYVNWINLMTYDL